MNDPFVLLGKELVRVAVDASPRRSWSLRWRSWLRRRPRMLVLVAAALIISGSAVGAVMSLNSTRSQPLSGTVPGKLNSRGSGFLPVSLSGEQYRIVVSPLLTAGEVGWCSSITYTYRGKPGRSGGGECGSDYPTRRQPLFGPDVMGFGYSAPAPQIGDTVHFLMTGPGVAYVRVGKTTIAVRHDDPDVPVGDGVVVFFLPAAAPPVTVPPAGERPPYYTTIFVPPHSTHDRLPPWVPRKAGMQRVGVTPAVALDRLGREIPYRVSGGYFVSSRWWQRPGREPNGRCQIERRGLPGLVAKWGHVTDQIRPVSGAQGTALLSCLSTEYYLDGWGLTAAVLLNAQHPGGPVGSIPGTQPVPGHPGTVTSMHATGFGAITAHRYRNAWLVIQGGRDLRQRLEALNALEIRRVRVGAK
jgi:hypothetical protein